MTNFVVRRVFVLEVDGRPTLVFEARNQAEAVNYVKSTGCGLI